MNNQPFTAMAPNPGLGSSPYSTTKVNPAPSSMSGASSSLPPMGPPSLPVDTNSAPELTQYEPNGTPHPNSPAGAFFASASPPRLADVPLATTDESRLPYSPPHPPTWTTPPGRNGANYGAYLPIPMQEGEFLAWGCGSSPQREPLRGPEFRLQRLIGTIRHTLDGQRPDYASDEQFGLRRSDYAVEEQLMHGIMTSQRALEATKKNRGHAEGTTVEGSEGESEEKSKSAADFECNICLDVAKDPVVTSCGHLFCWPCLYQWLHLHCDHNECPVCKGLVIEAKVTPIYGRGGLETPVGEKCGAGRGFGVEIPPRPRGSRAESLRQQLQRFMPRRLGERISTSWGHIFDEEMHGGVGYEGGRLQSFLVGVSNRLREWRMQREEGNVESGSNTAGVSDPQSNSTSSVLRHEIDNLHQPSSTDRLAAVSADLFRGLGMFVRGNSQAGASTSSVNHHTPVPPLSRPPLEATMAADQASAPSTMAVIQGNITVNDAATEPYSAESSRRGRSSTSGSLDACGGAFHAWKRRRMN